MDSDSPKWVVWGEATPEELGAQKHDLQSELFLEIICSLAIFSVDFLHF